MDNKTNYAINLEVNYIDVSVSVSVAAAVIGLAVEDEAT